MTVEPYWPGLFAKLFEKKNIADLITNVGAGQHPLAMYSTLPFELGWRCRACHRDAQRVLLDVLPQQQSGMEEEGVEGEETQTTLEGNFEGFAPLTSTNPPVTAVGDWLDVSAANAVAAVCSPSTLLLCATARGIPSLAWKAPTGDGSAVAAGGTAAGGSFM